MYEWGVRGRVFDDKDWPTVKESITQEQVVGFRVKWLKERVSMVDVWYESEEMNG